MLVAGLQLVGSEAKATTLLNAAREIHPDAFWLNGRIVLSDPSQSDLTFQTYQADVQRWNPDENDRDVVGVVFAARTNMRAKRYDLSLRQFQWVFRDILRDTGQLDPILTESRLSTVLQFWNELGQHAPAAIVDLDALRDECGRIDNRRRHGRRQNARKHFKFLRRPIECSTRPIGQSSASSQHLPTIRTRSATNYSQLPSPN